MSNEKMSSREIYENFMEAFDEMLSAVEKVYSAQISDDKPSQALFLNTEIGRKSLLRAILKLIQITPIVYTEDYNEPHEYLNYNFRDEMLEEKADNALTLEQINGHNSRIRDLIYLLGFDTQENTRDKRRKIIKSSLKLNTEPNKKYTVDELVKIVNKDLKTPINERSLKAIIASDLSTDNSYANEIGVSKAGTKYVTKTFVEYNPETNHIYPEHKITKTKKICLYEKI